MDGACIFSNAFFFITEGRPSDYPSVEIFLGFRGIWDSSFFTRLMYHFPLAMAFYFFLPASGHPLWGLVRHAVLVSVVAHLLSVSVSLLKISR